MRLEAWLRDPESIVQGAGVFPSIARASSGPTWASTRVPGSGDGRGREDGKRSGACRTRRLQSALVPSLVQDEMRTSYML